MENIGVWDLSDITQSQGDSLEIEITFVVLGTQLGCAFVFEEDWWDEAVASESDFEWFLVVDKFELVVGDNTVLLDFVACFWISPYVAIGVSLNNIPSSEGRIEHHSGGFHNPDTIDPFDRDVGRGGSSESVSHIKYICIKVDIIAKVHPPKI